MARSSSKTRRRDPDEKRARILAAAAELFAQNGFRTTATAQIAEAAGVSEGIVFHHFGSKKKLLAAVAADHGRRVNMAMFQAIVPGEQPDVEHMLRSLFEFASAERGLHRLFVMASAPGQENSAIRANREVVVGALSSAFEVWSREGYMHTDIPDITASLMFGLVESALRECFTFGDIDDYEPYLRECVRCVEGALQVPEDQRTTFE